MTLLVGFGTPSYVLYDVQKFVRGKTESFDYGWPIFTICCFAGIVFLMFVVRRDRYARLKPLWERPLALILLVLSMPLMAFVSLLIKFESPGPTVYRQERIGRNRRRTERRRSSDGNFFCDRRKADRRGRDLAGRPFIIYKLRSMVNDAEKKTGAAWSTGDGDPRVTRIGRIIRKTHIDELPQLYNVVLGQMSFVGPRPERPAFIEELSRAIADYHDRLQVLPGITGLAQVRQQHDESVEDVRKKIQYDRQYIRNASLLYDIYIALQTVGLMFHLFGSLFGERTDKKTAPRTPDVVLSGNRQLDNG